MKKPWARTAEGIFREPNRMIIWRPMSIQMGGKVMRGYHMPLSYFCSKVWNIDWQIWESSIFPESIETLHHRSASVFLFNLERQGGYQSHSAWRAVIAAGVTKEYNFFTFFFLFLFQEKQYLTSAEWFEEWNLSGKAQVSHSCHLH